MSRSRRGALRLGALRLGVLRLGALRLGALRLRGLVARPVARAAMRVLPPRRTALVAGLPDSEENSLVTALALAERFDGRVVLVARDPAVARELVTRTARALGVESAARRVEVVAKADPRSALEFVRATWVFYTHGLFDSPRPVGRRVHVNLWHGTGPKWNGNANQSVRIGADVLAAYGTVWGAEVARALRMPPGTVVVPGNARQDVLLAGHDRARLTALGLDPQRPLVLWLPTFRASARAGRTGLREGVPLSADSGLAARLSGLAAAHGVQLVVKTHRHDDDDYAGLGLRVISTDDVLAAGLSGYGLLGMADAVISDYSSVWVDFLATGRSVGLYCPDLERYEAERGLNRPGVREVAGGLLLDVEGADELFAAVAKGKVFRPDVLAAVRELLGVAREPGNRATAMLGALGALAEERYGSRLGLAVTSS